MVSEAVRSQAFAAFLWRVGVCMSTFSTESRNEYYNIELVDAANKLVTQVRPVEPGQQVLITFDTASDERVARATAGAVYSKGGIPTVIFLSNQQNQSHSNQADR